MKSKFVITVINGLLLVIPILALIILFRQLYNFIIPHIDKIMDQLNLDSKLQFFLVFLAVVLIIVLIVYSLGLVTQTKKFKKVIMKLDEILQNNNDIYRSLKLKFDNSSAFIVKERPPIFVKFSDKERPGFLIEKKVEEGKAIVFIPKDFNDYDGHVYIVPLSDIRESNASQSDFVNALNHLGVDLDIS